MLARRTFLRLAAVLATASLVTVTAGCGEAKRPDGGSGLLAEGAPAPEVVGEDPAGHEVRLSAQQGKTTAVYFYPKDNTPGCTKEACAFRDAWTDLEKAGVVIIGVSNDTKESHKEFQKEHSLPFALAADTSGDIARAYGVSKKIYGYDRVTFLVGPNGKIAKVWPSVDPGVHAKDVIAEAKRLGGT